MASGLLLLPALALQLRGGAAHADETGTAAAVTEAAPAPQEQQQPVAAEAPWRNYIAREFSFSYPPSIKEEQEDLFATVAPVVRSTLGALSWLLPPAAAAVLACACLSLCCGALPSNFG